METLFSKGNSSKLVSLVKDERKFESIKNMKQFLEQEISFEVL